jgi:predicted amidohydrolase
VNAPPPAPASDLEICALEVPASFGDPRGRLADIRTAIAAGPRADLIVVPECALTGYASAELHFDLRPFAEPLEGPTLAAYRALARERHVHFAGPLVEQSEGAFFNSFVVVDPRGQLLGHYRKRHPWFPERWASRGTLPYPLLPIAGLRVALAVCYDIHFVADEASDTLAAADVLLFPSAWVDDSPTDLRTELFGGLVRRFGLTVVNANWGQGQPHLPGQGRSRIVGPDGDVEAPPGDGQIARVSAKVAPKRARVA